jgi:tripartite-type tricarboxylate transporter receptor subunit TctC
MPETESVLREATYARMRSSMSSDGVGALRSVSTMASRAPAMRERTSARSAPSALAATCSNAVSGYEATTWYGVGVPKNTPAGIIDTLNKEINAALADPNMRARLADLGGTALAGSAADFAKLIADDTEKWAKVIQFAGIKPECPG